MQISKWYIKRWKEITEGRRRSDDVQCGDVGLEMSCTVCRCVETRSREDCGTLRLYDGVDSLLSRFMYLSAIPQPMMEMRNTNMLFHPLRPHTQ